MGGDGALTKALVEAGLEAVLRSFEENDIDDVVAFELTEADLAELGLTMGQRKRFLTVRKSVQEAAVQNDAREPASAPERRQLTVLFSDLVGSTRLATQLDPEDMREVISSYHNLCTRLIARHGGHFSHSSGDGMMAFFGFPVAHEDDAERALRLALAIVEAVRDPRNVAGQNLNVRVGVATGPVVVGINDGEAATTKDLVVGETPNLASRLQALAEPGEVVTAAETRRLVGGRFDFEARGPVEIRGFDVPREVFRVISENETSSRFEAQTTGARHPIVGRDQELATFSTLIEKARSGQGGTVLIEAAPGVGKSRLCQAVMMMIGGARLEWQCSAHLSNRALHPIAREVERAAGIQRSEPTEDRIEKLKALIDATAGWHADDLPLIADLVGLAVDGGSEMDAMTRARETAALLIRRIRGIAAAEPPLLLIVEDAHWSDAATMAFLDELFGQIADLPMLMIVTYRPELEPPAHWRETATHIALKHLPKEAAYSVVDGALGGRVMPAFLKDWILEKTDGVPLFIEELTKAIVDGLPEDAESITMDVIEKMSIPTTLRDSLMSRLDRVGEAKRVAQLAAVIGREFMDKMVEAIAPPGTDVASAMTVLTDAEMLLKGGLSGSDHFMFNHALVQDIAYESLLRRDRKEAHLRLAGAMLDRHPAFGTQEPEIVARHCDLGGRAAEAVEHWRKAGMQALGRAANLEAVNHLNAALRRLTDLPHDEARDRTELEIQMALMPACMATFGWGADEVESTCNRAHELAKELGDGGAMYGAKWGLWTNYYLRGDMDRALETSFMLRHMAQTAQPEGLLMVTACHAVAYCHYSRGELEEGLATVEAGLALFDLEMERQIVQMFQLSSGAALYALHAPLCWQVGRMDDARASARRAVEVGEALEHAPSLVQALGVSGWSLLFERDWEALERDLSRAMQICEEAHLYFMGPFCSSHLALARAGKDDLDAGLADLEIALGKMQATGSNLLRSQFEFAAADLELSAGRAQAALERLDRAGPEAAARGERLMMAEYQRLRGGALLALGDSEAGRAALAIAIKEAERRNAIRILARAQADMDNLVASQGD